MWRFLKCFFWLAYYCVGRVKRRKDGNLFMVSVGILIIIHCPSHLYCHFFIHKYQYIILHPQTYSSKMTNKLSLGMVVGIRHKFNYKNFSLSSFVVESGDQKVCPWNNSLTCKLRLSESNLLMSCLIKYNKLCNHVIFVNLKLIIEWINLHSHFHFDLREWIFISFVIVTTSDHNFVNFLIVAVGSNHMHVYTNREIPRSKIIMLYV